MKKIDKKELGFFTINQLLQLSHSCPLNLIQLINLVKNEKIKYDLEYLI